MLLVTHAVAGAVVATKINNPIISLPLVFGLHFLMDAVPHWDLGVGFKQRSKATNFFLALTDGCVGIGLVFWLFQLFRPFNLTPWLGMTVSLLPDFLEAPSLFLGFQIIPALDHVHSHLFHRDQKSVFWGLLPQVAIIFFCILTAQTL